MEFFLKKIEFLILPPKNKNEYEFYFSFSGRKNKIAFCHLLKLKCLLFAPGMRAGRAVVA